MDAPPTSDCTRGVASGSLCPRPAEVRVHFVNVHTGETNRREEFCPVHGMEAALLAFRSVDYPDREPTVVILSPLL